MKQIMVREPLPENNHYRIGMINYNYYKNPIIIKDYRRDKDLDVQFINIMENGDIKYPIIKNKAFKEFKNGCMKSPYDLSIYSHGYLEYANMKCLLHKKCYMTWKGILERSYDIKKKQEFPTYMNVTCDYRFHSYEYFQNWFKENYYQFEEEQMHLDKDILFKGNKIYSPETCCFVPARINTLLVKRDKCRGEYLIGVMYNKHLNKFSSHVLINNKKKFLGLFHNEIEAFYAYKEAKEEEIKRIADIYYYDKGGRFIPQFEKIYNALYNYEIDICD